MRTIAFYKGDFLLKDRVMSLKIITWNVNGLRALMKKNFNSFVEAYRPDILCLQETKTYALVCPEIPFYKYTYFNHSEQKKGYSGTATFLQHPVVDVRCIDVDAQHPEGRILLTEFKNCYLINVYVPNSQTELRRLAYRTQIWDSKFRQFLSDLQAKKNVIVCGDFNVAHHPIDLANPDTNHFNAGFTDEERYSFGQHLKTGLVDIFRYLHPDVPGQYTWWSVRTNSRARNIGWRIDYFLISKPLVPYVRQCTILTGVYCSDHAPVLLEIDESALGD